MIGRTLDHYRIEAKLGEGGMGVVYRARDTHLDRVVAIKVLPVERMAKPERKRRFVREAKAASALNHPNIITVYDVSNDGGVDYIAMEYVAGQALDRLIGRRGLPAGETIRYAIQIAAALAAAHEAGIIHRDLKPANIMVTGAGQVKLLDFGLAKLTEPGGTDSTDATQTEAALTEEGVLLGTVAYMSPEQAAGKQVDARSDIFSFGALLYEMVTGERPFQAESKLGVLTAIAHQEPKPVSEIAESIPPELETIIHRCLRKDPSRRAQNAADIKNLLEDLKERSGTSTSQTKAAVPARHRRWMVALAVPLLLAAGTGAWWLRKRPQPVQSLTSLTRLTSDSGLTTDPALSADGKLLAYASDRSGEGNFDIWVQQVAGGDPLRITRDEADERDPAFSPDASQIVFASSHDGGEILTVSSLGGTPRKIAGPGRRPRFSPDGQWIAYFTGVEVDMSAPGQLRTFLVATSGGEPRQFLPSFTAACYPIWTPDSKHLLFMGAADGKPESRDWWVAPLDGGQPVRTGALSIFQSQKLATGTSLIQPSEWLAPENQVMFSAKLGDSMNLWQVAISPADWKARPAVQRVTFGTSLEVQPSAGAGPAGVRRIVFSSRNSNIDIWSLRVDPGQGKALQEPQRITQEAGADIYPSLSADGRKMAFLSYRSGKPDVWIKDLDSGREKAVTANRGALMRPILSPDGSRIAYTVAEEGKFPLYIIPWTGGVAARVCDNCGLLWDWSSDGKQMLFLHVNRARKTRSIGLFQTETGEKTEILAHPEYNLYVPRFSPDGRWVSFAGNTGSGAVGRWFRAPFRGAAGVPVREWLSEPEIHQLWSADLRRRFFLSPQDGFWCLWSLRVDRETQRPSGAPVAVEHFHSARRSPATVSWGSTWISLARDRIAFSMDDITGNIWMTQLPVDQ